MYCTHPELELGVMIIIVVVVSRLVLYDPP